MLTAVTFLGVTVTVTAVNFFVNAEGYELATELKIEKLNMSVSHHMSQDFSILDPFALKPFKDGAEIF